MAQTAETGWALEAERDLWRAICAPEAWHDGAGNVGTHPDSLWYFIKRGWGAESFLRSNPSEPQWLYDPIHHPYARWYQGHLLSWRERAIAGVPEQYKIASVLPRGYGKTVIEKSAILWLHLLDRNMTTLLQSASSKLSGDILKSLISVMAGTDEDSQFAWLYGDWVAGATDKTKEAINHACKTAKNIGEPSIDTSTSNIGSTGYHPRSVFWDDPLEANKIRDEREAYLRAAHAGVKASKNSLHRNGLLVFTLTRYLEDDIAGRHFKEEGIASWNGMPCPHYSSVTEKVAWGAGVWHVYFYQTEDPVTGEPTHPKLWTKRTIADAKRIDAEDFACQQQNDPGASEHAPLVESQIPYLYMSYDDFTWNVRPKWATIHIDTAFKNKDNMGKGDDSAIVVWLADERDNGLLYLDTQNLKASNEWREEDFNVELIKVFGNLRRRGIMVQAVTDEVEPGGKEGTYKNRVLGLLRSAGYQLGNDWFIQLNRKKDKRSRIRTAVGHWATGYVRILLDRPRCDCPPPKYNPATKTMEATKCPHFVVHPVVHKMVNQILKVDSASHDDLADAQADGFISKLWFPPNLGSGGNAVDEGAVVVSPGDQELKSIARRPTNEEVLQMLADRDEARANGFMDDGVRGDWGDDYIPYEPVG